MSGSQPYSIKPCESVHKMCILGFVELHAEHNMHGLTAIAEGRIIAQSFGG